MTTFIERLEALMAKDKRVGAILRRSLAFGPGLFPRAYPYVEPFVENESDWSREIHYLVAGLLAAHWKEECSSEKISIARACAKYMEKVESASIEKRFISLIDADSDQLPHRIRQLSSLLKDYPIDFGKLLEDLLRWKGEKRTTQNAWAKDFYRSSAADKQDTIN